MKAIKSLFADDIVFTKVEYVKNHPLNEWHVYKRVGHLAIWNKIDERNTLSEAEELATSRGEKVVYMGIYEKGVKKGMTDWSPQGEPKKLHSMLVLPPDESIEVIRKPKEKRKSTGEFNPVETTSPRFTRQL